MSLILSGTDGLSDVDGSAATPAIRGTDANTGIFFPAADTIAFSEGGVEAMRINSSGVVNIGIGAFGTTPATTGVIRIPNASPIYARNADNSADRHVIAFNSLGQVAIAGDGNDTIIGTTSGNVGIGTASPNGRVTIGANATDTALSGTSNTQGLHLYHRSFGISQIDSLVSSTSNSGMSLRTYNNGTYTEFIANTQGNTTTFQTAGSERMRINSSGDLLIGTTSSSGKLTVADSSAQGTRVTQFTVPGTSNIFSTFTVSADSSNGAATAVRIGQNTSTSRSINAGGTINASGADYAEYMVKAGNFEIAKGDVCGIDANGKLTNVFSDAISFVVKSTNPSYVGGDLWGADLEGDALESARQTVDRIAFSGQVPVNVLGATAGQYIVPVNNNGAIKGQAVSNPTFEQYQLAVGKVIAIESDGRARIIVKVA